MFGRSKTRPAGRRLGGYHLDSPEGWHAAPLEGDDAALDEVAAGLGLEERAHEVFRGMLGPVVAEAREGGACFALAVWVPEPTTGVISGVLAVGFLLPDEGVDFTPEAMVGLYLDSEPDGLRVHTRTASVVDLPAGPASRRHEIISQVEGGEIEERLYYDVFAPGAAEALTLTFVSPTLQLGERLAAEAETIATSLTIQLA